MSSNPIPSFQVNELELLTPRFINDHLIFKVSCQNHQWSSFKHFSFVFSCSIPTSSKKLYSLGFFSSNTFLRLRNNPPKTIPFYTLLFIHYLSSSSWLSFESHTFWAHVINSFGIEKKKNFILEKKFLLYCFLSDVIRYFFFPLWRSPKYFYFFPP